MKNYSTIDKILLFNDLLPQVKIKVILVFSFFVLLSIISYFVLKYQFKNTKTKFFKFLSFIIVIIGIFVTLSFFPKNRFEQVYPNYNDKQEIKILNDNLAILKGETGNYYYVHEGRLSPMNKSN